MANLVIWTFKCIKSQKSPQIGWSHVHIAVEHILLCYLPIDLSREVRSSPHNHDGQRAKHQEDAEPTSTELEALGTMEVPYKRFEALPILTISSMRVEARGIAAEYSFSHWLALRPPNSDRADDTRFLEY